MHEIHLGSETDDSLFERLREAIRSLHGSVPDTDWAIAGSQEITTYKISLPSGVIEAVAETYIGITLRGPEDLVMALANKVTG
jgi:hypothetical protein